jgi:hypothetical protein
MPKLVHVIPKYRKHKQSGQAIVTLAGHDYLLGPHGTKASKREYDRLVSEFLASGRSASFGAPQGDSSVVEVAADYVRYAKAYYGTAPTSEYFRILRVIRPVKEMYGRLPAVEFGPLQLKAVRQRLIDEELSRTYINEFVRRVVAMFKWAVADGRIPAAVPEALAMVPGLRRGKTEARELPRSCPLPMRRLKPHCRISHPSSPTWSGCNGSPACVLPKFAFSARAIWIAPGTCGSTGRRPTKRSTTAGNALFPWGPSRRGCCSAIWPAMPKRTASAHATLRRNVELPNMRRARRPSAAGIDPARIESRDLSGWPASGTRHQVTGGRLPMVAIRRSRTRRCLAFRDRN